MRAALLALVLVGCNTLNADERAYVLAHRHEQPHGPVVVGDHAPSFSCPNLQAGGPPVALTAGKVNLVWFWATWSGPDKQAVPKIDTLRARYADRGLVISAVSVDDENRGLLEFIRESGGTYPAAWDEHHDIANLYQPGAEPTFYVIDRAGVVRFIEPGYHDGQAETMAHEIESLL